MQENQNQFLQERDAYEVRSLGQIRQKVERIAYELAEFQDHAANIYQAHNQVRFELEKIMDELEACKKIAITDIDTLDTMKD